MILILLFLDDSFYRLKNLPEFEDHLDVFREKKSFSISLLILKMETKLSNLCNIF
jgi:hypothetical protein